MLPIASKNENRRRILTDSILLKKIDLRAIIEGVIKEAQKVDLDKLERDVEEEVNRVAREKYKIFAGH